jgi:predicted kinase
MIILLDGSKGAGKSTTAKKLTQQLDNLIYLSIDNIRRTFPTDPNRDIRDKNEEAFGIIITKAKEALVNKQNVVIDCGVSEARAEKLEDLTREMGTPLYKFFLRASYDTQLDRVKERDRSKGRADTDIERFDEIYHYFNKKNLADYTIIETDLLPLDQIIEIILKKISK